MPGSGYLWQSQEGHMCLCWGLCNKIWTHIKNYYSPPHTTTMFFFFQGHHVRKFLSRGVGSKRTVGEISQDSRGICLPMPSVLHATKLRKLLWKLSGHRELNVFTLCSVLFAILLGNFRTVKTWERMTPTKERIKETGCIKYGGQRDGAGGGCISS